MITVSAGGLQGAVGAEQISGDSPQELADKMMPVVYQLAHAGLPKSVENRQRSLRDTTLEKSLGSAVPHETTPVRSVIQQVIDDKVVATIDGIRVLLPISMVGGVLPELPAAATVRITSARPNLSRGFFLVDGSRGTGAGTGMHTLRIYIHVTTAEAAPAVWNSLLCRLEALNVRYRAKVSSSAHFYPRRDAIVVYLAQDGWSVAREIADHITGSLGMGDETSPFAGRLAPGVAIAWEPHDGRPGTKGLSFGEHRARALVEGIVRHAVRADGVDLPTSVAESFIDAGIDPLDPSRNLMSPLIAV